MSDFNNTNKCVHCKKPVVHDWLCDPDSYDRENPDYYHVGCWFEVQNLRKELKDGFKQVQTRG